MQAAAILANHIKSLEFLLTAGRRGRKEIQAFQFAQLRRVVRHAHGNVPFYRTLNRDHGSHPSHLRSFHDLKRIPTITKSDLVLLEAKTITDRRLDPIRLIRHSTSGTSGVPTTVYRTWAEERLLNAFRRRSEFDYGLRPAHTVASVMPWRRRRIRVHELLARAGLFRNRFVDALAEPEAVLARLAGLEPDIVGGYPGVLERLARCMSEFHRSRIRPRFVMTGGETLTEQGRTCIEEAFGARLFNKVNSSEGNRR